MGEEDNNRGCEGGWGGGRGGVEADSDGGRSDSAAALCAWKARLSEALFTVGV